MFSGYGNLSSEVSHKSCPLCGKSAHKYIMFHIAFYWRCASCRIDVDDPKHQSKFTSSTKSKSWDDEITEPRYNYPMTLFALPKDCKMTTMMTSKNFVGADEADCKISATVTENGVSSIEQFQEKFPISGMNSGSEDDMWEDLAKRLNLGHGTILFSTDDIKSEYLKLRLYQRYPNKKIQTV